MRRATQPNQTYFQIDIRGTEITRPNASQLAAFVEAYDRLYIILRIATDPNYEARILLNRGYRLRQQDKLRVRSFGMASPFHASFLLLAVPGAVATLRWLAPICLDIYKTKRDDPKVRAETTKLQAEAYKALAEGRKADADARKSGAETEQILHDLNSARLEEQRLDNSLLVTTNEAALSLEHAKEVAEEINASLSPDKMPGNLEELLMERLPPQARLPLSRALSEMRKSSFVIVQVEVEGTQIADGDDTRQSKG